VIAPDEPTRGGRGNRARTTLAPVWRSRYLVLDQAVASLSNFLLMVLVGRWLDPSDYGVFALIAASWLIVLGVADSAVVDPMMVMGEEPDGPGPHVTAALVVGAAAAVVYALVSAGLGFTSDPAQTVLVLGIFLPSLVLQQLWRMIGFQRGRALASVVNDSVFLLVQLVALGLAFGTGRFSEQAAAGCWGLGALAAALLGFWQFRAGVGPLRRAFQVLHKGRAISDWLVLDFFVNRAGLKQVAMFVIAAVAGTQAIGALQAVQNLMGPTNILLLGATSAALVRGGAEMRAGDEQGMLRTTRIHGLVLAVAVGLYCVAVSASAYWLIPAVYGHGYKAYVAVTPLVALQTLIYTLDVIPTTRLRIIRGTRLLFSTKVWLAPVCLVLVWAFAATLGTTGAGLAVVVLAVCSTGGAWIALHRAGHRPVTLRPAVVSEP
jgi:O-antigen/teichoic acid export membrane protein